MFKEFHSQHESFEDEALRGNTSSNALSDIYFSSKNVEALQDAIRYQVYLQSSKQHVIGKQNDTDLRIIMRSIFLEYSKNLPYEILDQVRDLNSKVIEYSVPKILQEINMYLHYRTDISQNYVPLPRSENTSSAGSKTLVMKEF